MRSVKICTSQRSYARTSDVAAAARGCRLSSRRPHRKQVQDFTEKGYIQPSISPFGAYVLFVPKKDKSIRMCIDYRSLNKVTIHNCYPLPLTDEILDRLQDAQYFTKIDLRSGYHQIRVHSDDVYKHFFVQGMDILNFLS